MEISAAIGRLRNDKKLGKLDWPKNLVITTDASIWTLADRPRNAFIASLPRGGVLSIEFGYHNSINDNWAHRGDFTLEVGQERGDVHSTTEVLEGELRQMVENLIEALTPIATEIVGNK